MSSYRVSRLAFWLNYFPYHVKIEVDVAFGVALEK